MIVLNALVQIVAVVVVASGAAKLVEPMAFAELLGSLGLVRSPGLARAAGAVELLLGTAVLAIGGAIPALLLGAAYAVFAAVAERARRVGADSCGCFGSASAPPSTLHVGVNVASAVISVAAAAAGATDDALTVMGDLPLAGVPYALVVLAGAAAVIALDTRGGRRGSV